MKTLDHPSSTCLHSSESRALDPNGSDPGCNAHPGNILLLDFLFSGSKAYDANITIIANVSQFVKNSIITTLLGFS